jgi:hypothetical protein
VAIVIADAERSTAQASAKEKDLDGGENRPTVKRSQRQKSKSYARGHHETLHNVADWHPRCNRGSKIFFRPEKAAEKLG